MQWKCIDIPAREATRLYQLTDNCGMWWVGLFWSMPGTPQVFSKKDAFDWISYPGNFLFCHKPLFWALVVDPPVQDLVQRRHTEDPCHAQGGLWQLWHAWEYTHPPKTQQMSVRQYCPLASVAVAAAPLLPSLQKLLNMLLAALACLRIHPPLRHNKCQAGSTVLWQMWHWWHHNFVVTSFPKISEHHSGGPGMLKNRPTHQILQMSVRQHCPGASMAWMASQFCCYFISKNLRTLAALACSKIDPSIRYYKCQSGSTVLWQMCQGWLLFLTILNLRIYSNWR